MKLMYFILLLLVSITQSHASVMSIEYQYKSEITSIAPNANALTYLNNDSAASFFIKAGLDRTIIGTLFKDGTQLEQVESPLIGVSDKIGEGDQAYYGTKLDFSSIASDGQYTLQIRLINFFGETVNEYEFPFVRDTVSPTVGGLSYTNYKKLSDRNGAWNVGITGLRHIPMIITVSNIVDGAGIKSVHTQTYIYDASNQPQPYKNAEVDFDAGIKKASINFDLSPKAEHLALFQPNDKGNTKYGLQFVVTDLAGNTSQSSIQPLYWNNFSYPAIEPFAVHNPHTSNVVAGMFNNYELYRPNMLVYTNPMHVLYRVPKTEYQGYTIGGIRAVGQISTHTDANYVYLLFKLTHNNYNGNFYRFDSELRWATNYLSPKLTIASGVHKTPTRAGAPEYLYSDIGWASYSRWLIQNHQLPITITHVRQQVEPRAYVQVFSHRGLSCTIPVGASSCTISLGTIPLNLNTTGYLHDMSTLTSSDGVLVSSASWADVSWNDQHYPLISNIIYDNETKTLSAAINQPKAGSYFDMLRLKDVQIVDANDSPIPATLMSLIRNGEDYLATWDLKTMDEGLHQLYILAKEQHGPEHKLFALEYDNDTKSPEVTIGYENEDVFPEIVGDIRDIYFHVIDRYSTTSKIALIGLGINIQLGYSFTAQTDEYKKFNLELPKAFPTLKEDQFYTLVIEVTDEYGNSETIEKTIRYVPSNLIITAVQPYLTVDQSLSNSKGVPMARVYTEEHLITGFGQIATGLQMAEIQLSTDSTIPINVTVGGRDVVVEPGMIRGISIDLGTEGGRLEVEIFPGQKNYEGRADYLLSIPQLTSTE